MRESHPLLLAFGAVLATVGGGLVAGFVVAQALATKPFHLWNRVWFLVGFAGLAIGLLVLVGVLIDYAMRVRRGERDWKAFRKRLWRWLANHVPFTLRSPVLWRGFPSSRIVTKQSGILQVIRATYASPQQSVDVTGIVKALALILDGRLSFTADNHTMGGDPHYGVGKTLKIEYRLEDSEVVTKTFNEGESVNLP